MCDNAVLSIVIAYHPDLSELRENICSFEKDVSRILLWQNSPVQFSHPKVELCGDGTNKGISVALNYAWRYAKENGYDWLLIMDQDSKWVDFKLHLAQAFSENAPDGIFAARLEGQLSNEEYEILDNLSNSGTLVHVKNVDKIGGWDESFKVYGVDVDFYLNALSKGIQTYQLSKGYLIHHFGNPTKHTLFGRTYTTINYSPDRLYEIHRNHWICFRRYPEVALGIKKHFFKYCYKTWFPRMLLGEKNRLAKLWAIIRGTLDGLTYKINH